MFRKSAVEAAPPANGVEEGVEPVGSAESGGLGKGDPLDYVGTRLGLPDDLKFFAESVAFDGQQSDKVLRRLGRWRDRARRDGALVDVANDPAARSHADKLPLLGRTPKCRRHPRDLRRIRKNAAMNGPPLWSVEFTPFGKRANTVDCICRRLDRTIDRRRYSNTGATGSADQRIHRFLCPSRPWRLRG
jgi:hypothetical protein